ncbi:hypothetical protein [Candidatus Protochlamydia phocaeensis]|uniref:hypothetical protein n=1 Tax=Candidatus Protochlamydia phocaeensis TaxID=1414722 RepID=UPI00083929CB|nr:hypothetical protein [Candidatus Protochlamydia phocaeensis]
MNIAVLGFGSLINHPYSEMYQKEVNVKKPDEAEAAYPGYHISADSPFIPAEELKLPIRLGRISRSNTDNRCLTVVLDSAASDEDVFYAKSNFKDLNQAIKNLREREGLPESSYQMIGYVNLKTGKSRSRISTVTERISAWAHRNGYDAVVWTDLPAKGVAFGLFGTGIRSTGREVMPLLIKDPILLKNTKAYIRDLPAPLNPLQQDILKMDEKTV